ncbi:TldD/PmbA family protein [Nonomuraea deserti]|nr:TldD/PmbA family protein [Nonomuraea deserti]
MAEDLEGFESSLIDIAAHWCEEGLRLGAEYAQAFVEAGADLRWESRLRGPAVSATATSVNRRYGVGLLLRRAGVWTYSCAPLHEPQTLAEKISALCPGTPRIPSPWRGRSPLETVPATTARPLTDETCVTLQPNTAVRFIQDFFRQHRVIVDSAGTRRALRVGGGRRRAIATVFDGTATARAFTRSNNPHWEPASAETSFVESAAHLIKSAADQARALLRFRSMGHKTTPVVFGPKTGAAFLHELIGHALEADNLAKNSPYSVGLMGERLTRASLNLLDDPFLPDGMGSRAVDDDGQFCAPTPLVTDGTVVGRLTCARLDSPSGSGRRESYRHASLPRASNTSVLGGEDSVPSLLQPCPGSGLLYISSLGSGEFNPARGEFSFSAAAAHYLTSAGEAVPLKDVNLFGDAREAIDRLAGIADDVEGDNATCGKQGQSVLIGLYSPTMRFDRLDWHC